VSTTCLTLPPFSGCLLLHHLSTTRSPPNGCDTCSHNPSALDTSRLLQSKRNSFNPRTLDMRYHEEVLIQWFSRGLDPMVWISFPAPRNSRLHETKNSVCSPNSRTSNLRNDPDLCHLSSKMDGPDAFGT
jgi:hypothetical protein